MGGLIIGGIIVAFVIGYAVTAPNSKQKQRTRLKQDPLPQHLGIHLDGGVSIVHKLEQSLSSSYVQQMKTRFLKEHPTWTEHKFEWAFFELKRYFVMNSILKSVPMFSPTVDEVWHEMIMFTKDYETFSKRFFHETLHHIPNLDSTPIPGERGFFDYMYLRLFESTPNSRVLWGGMLRNPIGRTILTDFQDLSEEELLIKYFRASPEWLDMKKSLIKQVKEDIHHADTMKKQKKKTKRNTDTTEALAYQTVLLPSIYYSLYEEDQFQNGMSDWLPKEYYKQDAKTGGSSCSGYACSVYMGDDFHHDSGNDSGSDGGGFSCSSCGSGCSSS